MIQKKQGKGRYPQNTTPRAVGPRLLCTIVDAACGLAGFMQPASRMKMFAYSKNQTLNTVYFKNIKALIPRATAASVLRSRDVPPRYISNITLVWGKQGLPLKYAIDQRGKREGGVGETPSEVIVGRCHWSIGQCSLYDCQNSCSNQVI